MATTRATDTLHAIHDDDLAIPGAAIVRIAASNGLMTSGTNDPVVQLMTAAVQYRASSLLAGAAEISKMRGTVEIAENRALTEEDVVMALGEVHNVHVSKPQFFVRGES